MLKADVTKEYTKLEIVGDVSDICVDLTRILSAINERLSEKNAAVGHAFRVMFTAVFMDGICFDDDREHMEHYLEEGRKLKAENETNKSELIDFLDDFLAFLKDKKIEFEKAKERFDKAMEKDDNDEAE